MKKIDQIRRSADPPVYERMEISREIGEHKRQHKTPVLNPGREREILHRIAASSGKELAAYSQVLFRLLFDLSRSYQHRLLSGDGKLGKKIQNALDNTPKVFPKDGTVACQGIEGANSQLAADRLFPMADVMFFNNFAGVFQAVEKNLCKYGILPIENSLHGTVTEVYDLMRNHKFYILRCVKMQINHVLLGVPGTNLSRIKEIYSHEQALWQCGNFLKNLPGSKLNVCENTAVAAKKVAEAGLPESAGGLFRKLCSTFTAGKLHTDIQNSDCNYTRFIVHWQGNGHLSRATASASWSQSPMNQAPSTA